MYFIVRFDLIFLLICSFFKDGEFSNIENNYVNNAKSPNYTFTFSSGSSVKDNIEVDCFGLGYTFTQTLTWFFKQNQTSPLFTTFYLRTRNKSHRDKILTGNQFGLEWTDFNIRRKTVVIVHGFLSNGNEKWIKHMEDAFLLWEDVNVIAADWSVGSNTWNYYKAALNTRVVGSFIAKLFDHIANETISSEGPPENEWGAIHFVGHSLGAHISSFAANLIDKSPRKWKIDRITGLDPAQPCFRNTGKDLYLDRTDAKFVDIIHTNGRFLSSFGLGLPHPIGHVDFYPNGGKVQPGCTSSELYNVPLPKSVINQAICSHGRSHSYFTESIISAAKHNCTFWSHQWDLTYRRAVYIINETCNIDHCSEMGINSINYPQRGTFFTLTSARIPHCNVEESDKIEALRLMHEELKPEVDD